MKALLQFSLVIILSCVLVGCKTISYDDLKDGDIIFQDLPSSQSRAVQLATQSQYSHVGIIFLIDDKPVVYEAVQPVTVTPLAQWIDRGKDHHFVIKRLSRSEKLDKDAITRMMKTANTHLGKDYDIYFGWSDNLWYCSEYVWKIYERGVGIAICPTRTLKDFNLTHDIVKEKMAERYGDNIPYDETVVAPSDIFNAPKLETILSE